MGVSVRGLTAKGQEGTFWVMKMLPLDWGGVCMDVYICQNSLNCTLKMGAFYSMYNYASIKQQIKNPTSKG